MNDDRLLQDLSGILNAEVIDRLREQGITTYAKLFAILSDASSDEHLQLDICEAIESLSRNRRLDRRRAVPPLLRALKSPREQVKLQVCRVLEYLQSKRAIQPLINLMLDKSQPEPVRLYALLARDYRGDERVTTAFRQLIEDESDSLALRAEAVEWNPAPLEGEWHGFYIRLLSHPQADMRFWAIFRLSSSDLDNSAALDVIDHMAAFDHTLPQFWKWHIDREALLALEILYCRLMGLTRQGDNSTRFVPYMAWLISPAAEYMTFQNQYGEQERNPTYQPPLPMESLFRIDPAWLADRLREHWPEVELNVRQPRPQAYLLDWKLTLDSEPLSGGLHRDGYGVVLTGRDEPVRAFAAWYRSLTDAAQPLYLYEWAGMAEAL